MHHFPLSIAFLYLSVKKETGEKNIEIRMGSSRFKTESHKYAPLPAFRCISVFVRKYKNWRENIEIRMGWDFVRPFSRLHTTRLHADEL
jgi:hypothetical protein